MKIKHSLGGFPLLRFQFQMIGYVNPFDHQHIAVFLDLAAYV
jgi:hypothetical protein